jgi:Protein kinase domain
MPAASTTAVYNQQHHHQTSPMAFDAPVAMDVDNTPTSSRHKYAQQPPPPSYQAPPPVSKPIDSRKVESRSARDRRGVRSSGFQQPPPQLRQGGATTAPSPTTSTPNASSQVHGHFESNPPPPHSSHHPPASSVYAKDPLASATPPESTQPTFPPPAVTADSPQPSEVSQRRPAYLLHRDLVIGKGSYGQVCIASRGEPEGHSSGRSGKRKKFACKCVLLRSDPKYIAKLQEEVNVLRELRGHQNVIRLYDVFCVDNELFIITELGRGGDLFHLLTTHPKHGVTEAYAGKFLWCLSLIFRARVV